MFEPALMKEITEIAKTHDIEPEALMAVVEVESNGKLGAKVNGRMEPLIRFEGHYFYRLLSNSKRNKAVVRGLAHSRAGRVKNPLRQANGLVFEARDGAAGQIKLMMRYIKKARLISKLQNHDWAGFARAYNGPAYARYKYHTKMQNAYLRFLRLRRKPDNRNCPALATPCVLMEILALLLR